jgi:hypothetical protein
MLCIELLKMDPLKKQFVKNEFLTMSVIGALGRSNTYSKSASEKSKKSFRNALRKKLEEIGDTYVTPISEEGHFSNIKKITDDLTPRFSNCLKNGRFRIGIAQKALNLYLKYLWCVGFIPVPPHCPFDSIIIGHLPECRNLNWTELDNIDDYNRLVDASRKNANGKPIAEWELEIWLNSVQSFPDKEVEKSKIDRNQQKCFDNIKKKEPLSVPEIGSMPREGDVFVGKINDLSLWDADSWRRRDITFYKHERRRRQKFAYPIRGSRITLTDTDGVHYKLNFSKPETENKVCLGTPSRLKLWYRKKGFDDKVINPNEKIYFVYTGREREFIVLTEEEYNSR